jgi:trans-aconitate methyltransferase
MSYDYDKLYGETRDALGAPTKIFTDFFGTLSDIPRRVLDIGCGQGRDALFIARLGHSVVGVDLSHNGIRDLNNAAQRENLPVQCIAADITTFTPEGEFDILLVDRTLHMLPQATGFEVLEKLIKFVTTGGWVLIADETTNIAGFKKIFANDVHQWRTDHAQKGNLFLQRA